jgi:uncharacterized protein (DUF1330 family)
MMLDNPVYVIANFTIDEPSTYREYEKGFFPLLKRHGGKFITYDDKCETLEGPKGLTGRTVLFTFPGEEAAKAWFDDPDYQALSEHRRNGTTMSFITLVHGQPRQD